MKRRKFLVGCGCVTSLVLAGCLGGNDDEDRDGGGSSDYLVVAGPYDTAPPKASTTSIDDPKVEGPVEEVVVEAIETNRTATQRLDEAEREAVTDRIDELPGYEGDDEFEPASYVTRNDDAAAVFYERED
ncbi:hypothetical protein SAMN04487967_0821 [Natronorubrum sediminis]|uniref:Uncharacterized protein n=1 Tax=Natronorubrum sediminis TaxID=640943 RepID=A0A1H6FNI9_9EURY|nr:hypothetical protein [Natronorubrum sediminis]SEH12467.1 hypothetical protein SAMN04487967_0821 [Natronorubrum sediminis]